MALDFAAVRKYISYVLLIVFTLVLFPPHFFDKPVAGLDASWNIALHLALKYHMVFGKDFVFTYGPLGIFHSRYPTSVSMIVYLLFDLYMLITWFLVLRDIFRNNYNFGVLAFLFLATTISMYDQDLWYLSFFLFYIFSSLRSPRNRLYIFQAALLAILCFYYKMSLGVTTVSLFLFMYTYMVIRKKIDIRS